MSLRISCVLKLIIEELKRNCKSEQDDETNRHEFKELLAATNATERLLIANCFCHETWNIGSLRVLGILQELRILTATEFVLSMENIENINDIQLILNDFLEAEFELLSNLYITASYDATNAFKLNTLLDDCIGRLYADLLGNPDLSDLNYLEALKSQLPADILRKLTLKHVDIILELHTSNIDDAFSNFSGWINEAVDHINFTKALQKSLICEMEPEVLSHMLKISTKTEFGSWRFYLIMLQTILSNCKGESMTFMKRYLKTRLREVASLREKQPMLHLLLTARAATAITMDVQKNIDAYADWYRQNIGEMKFILQMEEFQNVCDLLDQCTEYEREEDYLEVHATISISPPVMCGRMVQSYKSKCKLRLSQIKSKKPGFLDGDNESITID